MTSLTRVAHLSHPGGQMPFLSDCSRCSQDTAISFDYSFAHPPILLAQSLSFAMIEKSSRAMELNSCVSLLEGTVSQLAGKLGFQMGDHLSGQSVGFKSPLQVWMLPGPHFYPESCLSCICISGRGLSLYTLLGDQQSLTYPHPLLLHLRIQWNHRMPLQDPKYRPDPLLLGSCKRAGLQCQRTEGGWGRKKIRV